MGSPMTSRELAPRLTCGSGTIALLVGRFRLALYSHGISTSPHPDCSRRLMPSTPVPCFASCWGGSGALFVARDSNYCCFAEEAVPSSWRALLPARVLSRA